MRDVNARGQVVCLVLMMALLVSCGHHVPVRGSDVLHNDTGGRGRLLMTVENLTPKALRTIVPSHVTPVDLQTGYVLRLTGTTGYQNLAERVVAVTNGQGTLGDIPAGLWELTLTAYAVGGADPVLRGRAMAQVTDMETTSVSFTLKPILTESGTVRVQFVLPPSVVSRLDPQGNNTKQVTAALYYDTIGTVVAGTEQRFTVTPGTAATTLTYTANAMQVPSGRYTLRLDAPYTVNNASTGSRNVTYNMGWRDILYVEGNRESAATVNIPEVGTAMGVPGNPYRQDKANGAGSSATQNFVNSTSFNPWGETLWLYGANWDGNGSDLNGNEILVVSWTPVFNADYYEVELLVHPFANRVSSATQHGKFPKVVTTDAEWDALRQQSFTAGGQSRGASYMRFSGSAVDPDYYKTRTYTINCANGASSVVNSFVSCAYKTLARTLFATGTQNFSYRIAAATDAFDGIGTFSYGGVSLGKVGLEGDCGVLGVLVPSFSPQTSLVYRVRAVNRFGYSNWVYWKGGKW